MKAASRKKTHAGRASKSVEQLLAQARTLRAVSPREALALCEQARVNADTTGDRNMQGWCACELGICRRILAEYPAALVSLHEAYRLFDTDRHGKATAAHNLGIVYTAVADAPNAGRYLDESLALREELKDEEGTADVLHSLGNRYLEAGQHQEAIHCYHRALSVYRAFNKQAGISKTSHALGNLHCTLLEWREALVYFRQALEERRAAGDLHTVERLLINMGMAHEKAGEYETSMRCRLEALVLADELDDDFGRQRALAGIGSVEAGQGRHEQALQHFVQALDITQRTGDKTGATDIAFKIGVLHRDMNVLDNAVAALEQSLQYARELNIAAACCQACRELADVHELRGDPQQALVYYKEYNRLFGQLQLREKQQAVERMEMLRELEHSRQEEAVQRLKRSQLELAMQHKRQEIVALAARLAEKNQSLRSIRESLSAILREPDSRMRDRLRVLLQELPQHMGVPAQEHLHNEVLHARQEFMASLSKKYPDLSPAELRVCALVRSNFNTKEIAGILNVSVRNVEMHRYRIRRKLHMPQNASFAVFLLNAEV